MKKAFYTLFFLFFFVAFALIIVTFEMICSYAELNDDIFGSTGYEIILLIVMIPFSFGEFELFRSMRLLLTDNNKSRSQIICASIKTVIAGISILSVCTTMFFSVYEPRSFVIQKMSEIPFFVMYITLFLLFIINIFKFVISKCSCSK